MREILFRGQRCDNGEWVYGNLITDGEDVFVLVKEYLLKGLDVGGWIDGVQTYEAVPETVGQYTGLTDKNGTKIFEGDIVKHIQKYEISGEVKSIAVIKWNEAYSCWSVEYTNGRITAFLGTEYHKLEVIGDVHDNPDLIKA